MPTDYQHWRHWDMLHNKSKIYQWLDELASLPLIYPNVYFKLRACTWN